MRSKIKNNSCACQNVSGEGLLGDIFLKPFIPKKKTTVEKLNPEVGLYSEMALESYNKTKSKMVIADFTKDTTFNQQNCLVYVSNDTIILTVRGTDPKNTEDIFTDIALALNKLKYTSRYREINSIFKKVFSKYKYIGKSLIPYKFIATGHSLGGSLCLQLLIDNPNKLSSIHIFNAGGNVSDIKKGLTMKLGKFLGINYYKNISKKINIYRVTGDLISFTNRFLEGNYYDIPSNSLDRHGMSNFKTNQTSRVYPSDIQIKPKTLEYKTLPPITSQENTEKPSEEVIIKPNEEIIEEQPQGEGIINNKNKKKNYQANNKMDIDNMKMSDMLCYIRSNKKVKNNMAGYSKLNQAGLREALKQYLQDGVTKQRVVKQTEWGKALKKFNEGKETFIIPKKGSSDYMKVKNIMSGKVEEQVEEPVVRRSERKKKRKVVIDDE